MGGGLLVSIPSCSFVISCSPFVPTPDPSDYIGNMTGTNWKGYNGEAETQKLTITTDEDNATITSNTDYVANDLIIPNQVKDDKGKIYNLTSIDNNAFDNCTGLTGNLTIQDSVISIGSDAFQYCSGLNGNLTIPDSVVSIGEGAFYGCANLISPTWDDDLKISYDTNNDVYYIRNGENYYCLGKYSNVTITGDNPSGLLTIQPGTKVIGDCAFYECSDLTKNLNIPDTVTSIGVNAFRNCSGFDVSLTLSNSLTSIGDHAFEYCSSIAKIISNFNVLPKWIGSNIFSGMKSSGGGGVVANDGDITSQQFLTYLIGKGLPDAWHT